MFSLKRFIKCFLVIFGAFLLAAVLGLSIALASNYLSPIWIGILIIAVFSASIALLFSMAE